MNISSSSHFQKKIQNEREFENKIHRESQKVSPFESSSKPAIPPALYLQLLCHTLQMPEEHTVCALVLINRICTMSGLCYPRIYQKDKDTPADRRLTINSLTVHRLILTSLLVTHKYFTDFFYLNSDISKAGGVSLQELNQLEEEFLELIDFNLSVEGTEYDAFMSGLTTFFTSPLSSDTAQIIQDIQAFQAQQADNSGTMGDILDDSEILAQQQMIAQDTNTAHQLHEQQIQ